MQVPSFMNGTKPSATKGYQAHMILEGREEESGFVSGSMSTFLSILPQVSLM